MEMFWFAVVMIVLIVFVFGSGNGSKKETAIKQLHEIGKFIDYCGKHKEELPENFKERFNEMEEFILNNKIEDNYGN